MEIFNLDRSELTLFQVSPRISRNFNGLHLKQIRNVIIAAGN